MKEMDLPTMVLSGLAYNDRFSSTVLPTISNTDVFESMAQRFVFSLVKDFVVKYNKVPKKSPLMVGLEELEIDEETYDETKNIIKNLSYDENVFDWSLDETEQFLKDRYLELAIREAIDIYHGENENNPRSAIPEIVSEAINFSFDDDLGHNYFEDTKEQYEWYFNEDTKIPFSINILNTVTNGGVPRGTVNIVQAGINVGKSMWLAYMAASYMSRGMNCVIFTLEEDKNPYRERIDVNLLNKNSNELRKETFSKKKYRKKIENIKKEHQGNLYIKNYMSGEASTANFSAYLKELKMKKGFEADIILIDYITEASSKHLPKSAMRNTDHYYGQITREFRNLGKEFDAVVWTAAQFDRAGQKKEDVDVTNTGQSITIPKVADFMIALVQPEELADRNMVAGIIVKNRYRKNKGKGSIRKFRMTFDVDHQRFLDYDEDNENTKVGEGKNKVSFENAKLKSEFSDEDFLF